MERGGGVKDARPCGGRYRILCPDCVTGRSVVFFPNSYGAVTPTRRPGNTGPPAATTASGTLGVTRSAARTVEVHEIHAPRLAS